MSERTSLWKFRRRVASFLLALGVIAGFFAALALWSAPFFFIHGPWVLAYAFLSWAAGMAWVLSGVGSDEGDAW